MRRQKKSKFRKQHTRPLISKSDPEALPKKLYRVFREILVFSDNCQPFNDSLRDDDSIKGVPMMKFQTNQAGGMFKS